MDHKEEKKSSTERLASDIETLTGAIWGRAQREEVQELIRKYRFEQVSAAMAKVTKLVRESGNAALSEQIFLGKF